MDAPAPAPVAKKPEAVSPATKSAEVKAPEAKAAAQTSKTAAPAAEVKTPPPAKTVAALIQQANSEPAKPPVKPPAPKPAAAAPAAPVATPGPATGAPRQLVVSGSAPAAAKPAAASGGIVLQIGAYKSQADAATAWKTYQAKHAALLAGYSDNVQQVDLGEKGTWYRLRVGGFSDREVATALCDRLKADGGACILGR